MIELGMVKVIGSVIGEAFGLVDKMHTSDAEKLEMKHKFLTIQGESLQKALEYEARNLEAKASIITAEAKSEHWLAACWRPIVMLVFTALVVSFWMGWSDPEITDDQINELFLLIQIGLGGYVVGRSAEKITKTVVNRNIGLKQ